MTETTELGDSSSNSVVHATFKRVGVSVMSHTLRLWFGKEPKN